VLFYYIFSYYQLMTSISKPNEDFNFEKLTLTHPTGIQGGAYFTQIKHNYKPLYIEAPPSLTKQGIIKSGKKMFCDLMFDNTNNVFITWMEKLETECHQLIYKNSEEWFETSIELDDIESAFTSPIKLYKSGKYYLVRSNVKMNYNNNIPNLRIYNESEKPLTLEDITSSTKVVSILEFQGIKFTNRTFQLDIELKQCMVLDGTEIFDNCLIKPIKNKSQDTELSSENSSISNDTSNEKIKTHNIIINTDDHITLDLEEENKQKQDYLEKLSDDIVEIQDIEPDNKEFVSKEETNAIVSTELVDENNYLDNTIEEKNDISENDELDINFDNLDSLENETKNSDSLVEYNINSKVENVEPMTLKDPNEVYYEIYQTARKKAILAKSIAIKAFLEVKNIKNTYNLNILEDDEINSDLDDLSQYSENDLENDLEVYE